jgi:peptidoglycan/LPS O-acetylase OafA/YrhL
VHAWWPPATLAWNLPSWSISVEVAFYLVFAPLARVLLRMPRARRGWVMVGTWAASMAVTGVYAALQPDGPVGPDSEAGWIGVIKYWPPARLPELLFGMALGALFVGRGKGYEEAREATPQWLGPVSLGMVLMVLLNADEVPYAMLHNALLMPAFGGIVWSVATAREAMARVLGSATLFRIGRASYDVYILQMPLMYLLLLAIHARVVWLEGAWFMAVFTPLVFGVGLAFHRWVERPARRWIESWLDGVTRAAGRRWSRAGRGGGTAELTAERAAVLQD